MIWSLPETAPPGFDAGTSPTGAVRWFVAATISFVFVVVSVLPFVAFALGISLGASWSTWH